jgi:hypothetical protein
MAIHRGVSELAKRVASAVLCCTAVRTLPVGWVPHCTAAGASLAPLAAALGRRSGTAGV